MTNFNPPSLNLPNEDLKYTYLAQKQAQYAGIFANLGCRFKAKYYNKEAILQKWQEFMVNAPILLHNSLFLLFFVVDIIVSWEMIKVIISNGGLFVNQEVPWWATLLLCLLINGWAAVTAHFIGKGWSREIQDWERWNYALVKGKNNTPPNLIDNEMRQEVIRSRFLAIISGLVLLMVVGIIVYYRNILLEDLNGEQTGSFKVLAAVMVFLPIAILIGELFTGDYIWYSIRWLQTILGRNSNRKKFLKYKEKCGLLDQVVVQYIAYARHQKEPIQIYGDLEQCQMRIKHRSHLNDNYMDPFEKLHRIGFTFRGRKEQKPIPDARVFGIFQNGTKTGDYHTDSDGKVTLYWEGDFNRLDIVNVLGKEYSGPFQADAEHYIDLPEDLVLSENGHAQPSLVTAS